jgi:hypothetical protein
VASQQLAVALRAWLPEVIQQIDPWVSSEDIDKGSRWSAELNARLAETSQGIICVTPTNFDEPWLNFEAGAQATGADDKSDMSRLVKSLNSACASPLEADRLSRAFEKYWPDFEAAIGKIDLATTVSPVRDTDDMVRETLERVREIERALRKAPSETTVSPLLETLASHTGITFKVGDEAYILPNHEPVVIKGLLASPDGGAAVVKRKDGTGRMFPVDIDHLVDLPF